MKKRNLLLMAALVVASLLSMAFVNAQEPQPAAQPQPVQQPHPPHPPMDPLGEAMFPPDMIMQHTRELNLTPEQKTFMRAEIQKTTTRFNELQWQLQDAMEALHEIMKSNSVNEQQALVQLDKVLDAEREIKRLHIGMAIRIKNQLTPEQQAKLHAMHRMMGQDGGPGGPGPGPRPQPKPEGAPKPAEPPLP